MPPNKDGTDNLFRTKLPLSFMAAFFSINIDVFPVNADDKLELAYVLKYMRTLMRISREISIPIQVYCVTKLTIE